MLLRDVSIYKNSEEKIYSLVSMSFSALLAFHRSEFSKGQKTYQGILAQ